MTSKAEVLPKKAKYGQIVAVKRTGEDAEGVPFPLCKLTCVIGRSEDADIRLHLASVSLKHCIISVDPDSEHASLETFATIIPSYLNENPLERNSKVPLKHGDVISVANRRFRFEYLPPNFTPKQVSVASTPVVSQEAPKTQESASGTESTEISSTPSTSEIRSNKVVKIFTPMAKPPITGILRRRSSVTPALPSETIENAIVGSTPNAKASAAKADIVNSDLSVSTSLNEQSASEDGNQQPEAKESQTSTSLSTPALKRVSFGPYLSPEQYDSKLPPVTPVKRGATPSRASLARSKLASTAEPVIEEDEREGALYRVNPEDVANDSQSTAEEPEVEEEMESDLLNTTVDSGSSDVLNVSEEIDTSSIEKDLVSDVNSPASSKTEESRNPMNEISSQDDNEEADLSLSQADLSPVEDSSMLSSSSLLLSPKEKPPVRKASPISSPEPQIKLHIESDSPTNPVQIDESLENAEAEQSPNNPSTEESSENMAVEEPSQDPAVIDEPVQEELVSTVSAEVETTHGDLFNESDKEAVNESTLDNDTIPSPAGAEEEVYPNSDSESTEIIFIAEDEPLPKPCEVSPVALETSETPDAEVSQENVELETSNQINPEPVKENLPQETTQMADPADISVASADTSEVPNAEDSETPMDVDATRETTSESGKESSTKKTNLVEENITEATPEKSEVPQLPVDPEPEVAAEESPQEAEATTETVPEAVPVDEPTEGEKAGEDVSPPPSGPPTENSSTPTEAVNHVNQFNKKQRNRRKTPHEVKAISPVLEGVAELFNTPLSAKTVQRRRLNLNESTEAEKSPFRRSRRIVEHSTPKQAVVAVRRLTDEQVSAIQTELRTPTRGKPRAAKIIALADLTPQTAKSLTGRSRKTATSEKVQENKEESKTGADEEVGKTEENVEEEAKPKKRSRTRKVSETSTEQDAERQPAKQMKKTLAVVVVPVKIPEIEDKHQEEEEEQDSADEEVKETSKGKKAGRGSQRKTTKESEENEVPVTKGKRAAKKPAKKDEDDEKIAEPEEAASKGRAKRAIKKDVKEDEDLEHEEPAPKTRGNRRTKKIEDKEEEETAEVEKPAPKSRAKRGTKKEEVQVAEAEKLVSKPRAKRGAKQEDVQEEAEVAGDEKPALKSRAKRGAKKEVVEEEAEPSEDEKPAARSRAKRSAKKDVPEEEVNVSPPKRGRNLLQKTTETPSEPPSKSSPRRGRGAKAKGTTKNGKEAEAEIVDEEASLKEKPTRSTRRKVKAEEIEEEEMNASSTKQTKAPSTKGTKKNGKAKREEAVGLDDVEMAHQHKGHAAHLHEEKLRSLEDSVSSPRRVGTRRKVQIESPDEERSAPKRATRSRK